MFMKQHGRVKQAICCLLAAVSLMGMASGCQKKDPYGLSPNKPISITIWHYYNGSQKNAFDSLVTEFNETVGREKGIVLEATSQGSIDALTEAVKNAAGKKVGAAEMPDIFATYVDTAREIDTLGGVAALDEYLTQDEKNEYVKSYLEEGRFDNQGSLKVFPMAKSTELLMINKILWEPFAAAKGVTEADLATWEGLAEVAEKYYQYTDAQTSRPNDGKAFFGRDAYANYMIVGSKQLGHEIFSVNGGKVTLKLERNEMKRLWDNLYAPYLKGYFTKNGRFASDDMKTEDIIAAIASSTGATYLAEEITREDGSSYPVEYALLPVPNFKNTEPYAVQQGAGMAVSKSTPSQEYASIVFLKWFTESERNIRFCLESSYLPVKAAANDPALMQKVMQETKLSVPELVQTSVQEGMKQCKAFHLFTSKAFDNGYAARTVLENSMLQKAEADRQELQARLAAGEDRQAVLAEYLTDENFSGWLATLNKELKSVLQQ